MTPGVDPWAPFDGPPAGPPAGRAWRGVVRRGASAVAPRRLVTRGPARSGQVALTFDDGPHPEATPRVLDALAGRGIAATFFLVGDRARRLPGLVRRIAREGHSVGIHSHSHPWPGPGSGRPAVEEAARAGGVLSEILGAATDLYRPPYGWVTARGLGRLWLAGYRVVLWNVDPRDHALGSAEELRGWFRRRPPRAGDLVLMHDDRPLAPAVIPDLADLARARGLGFATLDDWLGRPRPGAESLASGTVVG